MGELTDLLDRLKDEGWSPAQRAIVYTEWRQMVGATLVRPPPNDHDQAAMDLSARVRDVLLALKSPPLPGQSDPLGLIPALMDQSHSSTDDKIAWIKGFVHHTIAGEMDENGWCDWRETLVGSVDKYQTFFDMDMDEEDLRHVMASDRLGLQELPPGPRRGNLAEAHAALHEAFLNSGFSRLDIPALDAEDASRVWDLADCLSRLNAGFKQLGGETVRPGINQALFLGLDRSGSSGFATKKVLATSPTPGLSFIEVLAHECLHGHDEGMSWSSEKSNKERVRPGSLLEAWSTLFSDIRKTSGASKTQVDWKAVADGFSSRWSDMGLPRAELEESFRAYQSKSLSHSDFRAQLIDWFTVAGRGSTAAFRADTVLVECELMNRGQQGRPVWQQFTDDFDDLRYKMNTRHGHSVGKEDIYGTGYFSGRCEEAARSFQAVFAPAKDASNPYASRWLVFPDDGQTEVHRHAWETFFQHPAVRSHYQTIPSSSPSSPVMNSGSMPSLASRIRSRTKDVIQPSDVSLPASRSAHPKI